MDKKIKCDGFIKKGKQCEYKTYCSKANVRCLHSGENARMDYHCGYCKSFRMIDALRKIKNEKLLTDIT